MRLDMLKRWAVMIGMLLFVSFSVISCKRSSDKVKYYHKGQTVVIPYDGYLVERAVFDKYAEQIILGGEKNDE